MKNILLADAPLFIYLSICLSAPSVYLYRQSVCHNGGVCVCVCVVVCVWLLSHCVNDSRTQRSQGKKEELGMGHREERGGGRERKG